MNNNMNLQKTLKEKTNEQQWIDYCKAKGCDDSHDLDYSTCEHNALSLIFSGEEVKVMSYVLKRAVEDYKPWEIGYNLTYGAMTRRSVDHICSILDRVTTQIEWRRVGDVVNLKVYREGVDLLINASYWLGQAGYSVNDDNAELFCHLLMLAEDKLADSLTVMTTKELDRWNSAHNDYYCDTVRVDDLYDYDYYGYTHGTDVLTNTSRGYDLSARCHRDWAVADWYFNKRQKLAGVMAQYDAHMVLDTIADDTQQN